MTSLIAMLNEVKHQEQDTQRLRAYIVSEFPNTVKALRLIDIDYRTPKRRKGFNLVKRENKRQGFIYYVRYSHEGKMLPTKWNTHTNNLAEAERFALENKERLVSGYLRRRDTKMYEILGRFYESGSEYLACEEKRNRPISETTQRNYHSVINQKLVPFLKERKKTGFEQIDVQTLSDFQDKSLAEGKNPQTVNDYLKAVRRVFHYLVRKGIINENPCINLTNIPVHDEDKMVRGCYELGRLKGVFTKRWRDPVSYLLCLIIYTTGMRNEEIENIRMKDIITMEGCHFVDIKESKTPNGVRMVPLHKFVYQKLKKYAAGKTADEKVFRGCTSVTFSQAAAELARHLKSETEAAEQNISFYSGRHFYKTMMNSGGLGEDVEEIFMGHRVSNDVAKRYNHKDKQGSRLMIKKAKQALEILDKELFAATKKQR
jgi:site-specific recombinase XerD